MTIYDWLFDSPSSILNNVPRSSLAGYVDAVTKDRVDYQGVKEASTYISTALVKEYGFKQSDTISLFSRNTIWYPVMMFGAVRAGGMVSGASPAYNVEEMAYALKTASAKFLATSPTSMGVASKAAAQAGISKEHIFLLEGELPGYTTIKQLINMGKSYGDDKQTPAFKIPPGKKNKDVCAFLSFSSGTTGLPKAVSATLTINEAFSTFVLTVSPGDDRTSERHSSMSSDSRVDSRSLQKGRRSSTTVSHYGLGPWHEPTCRS